MVTSKKHLNTSYSNVPKRISLEARFNTLETKVDNLGQRIIMIERKSIEHDSRFVILEKRTALIPKLYDNVDKLIGEIIENRNDRIILNSKLGNHEKGSKVFVF